MTSNAKQVASFSSKYAASHWAYKVDADFLIKKYYDSRLPEGVYMVHYLNPSDRNGYRSILKLFSDDATQLESLWNRLPTADEYAVIFSVVPEICQHYSVLGLVPQTFMLGNNSQQCVEGQTVLGNDKEPYFLYVHFYGRGVASHDYVTGIPLGGNDIGKDVDLRQKTVPTAAEANVIRCRL